MRMRIGFAVGFGVGYLLGARAGRERYEKIASTARQAWESEPANQIKAKASEVLHEAPAGIGKRLGRGPRAVDVTDATMSTPPTRPGPARRSDAS